MYKIFFINQKTKGRNVTFLRADSYAIALAYASDVFGDNLIEVKRYEPVNR